MAYNLFFVKFYENTDIPVHLTFHAGLVHEQERWIVVRETGWLPEPKIFTTWLFTEKKKKLTPI